MSDRTVLITGGSGFIGSHTARLIAETGNRVILFDVQMPDSEASMVLEPVQHRITIVLGGVDDLAAVRAAVRSHGVTHVVHAGAIANTAYLRDRPLEANQVNFGGTLNVLETMRDEGLDRLVYLSSVGVLPPIQYEPIDARHPLVLGHAGPGSGFYGAAKAAGELFCFAYGDAFGLDFIVIRPSAVYGLGMRNPIFIKSMVENSVRGLPTRFAHGRDFGRDYTHVADLAQLIKRALDAPPNAVSDRLFYGATGKALVTPGQIADVIREHIPDADIEIGSGLSAEDRWKASFRGVLDIGPARTQLGYAPQYDMPAGVAEFLASYRLFCSR